MIAGLENVTEGTILLEGEEISKPGSDRGMVFQEPSLFPWLNVKNNVLYPIKKQLPKQEAEERVKHFLKMVHLSKFTNHYTYELSGWDATTRSDCKSAVDGSESAFDG